MKPSSEKEIFVICDPSGDIKVAEPLKENQLKTNHLPVLKPGEVEKSFRSTCNASNVRS
jgi:hypothetical protein